MPHQAQEKGKAMIDEQNEVRRINWNEVFAFTHIFKGFKMAIQPSKMLLALAAILLIYVWGAWVLDSIWGLAGQTAATNEIAAHVRLRAPEFQANLQDWRDKRVEEAAKLRRDQAQQLRTLAAFQARMEPQSPHFRAAFVELLQQADKGKEPPTLQELEKKSLGDLLYDAEQDLDAALAKAEDLINKAAGDNVDGRIKNDESVKDKDKAKAVAAEDSDRALRAITATRVAAQRQIERLRGQTPFAAFLDWERDCIVNAVRAVRYGNITGGLGDYRQMMEARGVPTQADLAAGAQGPQVQFMAGNFQAPPGEVVPAGDRCGLLYWKLMALHGVLWLVCQHWVFAALLGLFALAVWALFGGAIYRIAALHAAREEKISASQALRFAGSKFFSFFCAPLVPALIILGVGLMMALVALLGNIPFVGPILIGLPFILAIVGGLLIAFITVGLAGGGALMYPTIAVEGSDSFDAISRSFSYIFARPWRAVLYSLIMTFYGVITFLFVRTFAWIALAGTHCFVKMGIFTGGSRLAENADRLDVMWPAPTLERLAGEPNWHAMSSGESVGGLLIWFWVSLVAAATLAYLISYCVSGTTIIYYLLRRKVDATDLDDVYVEETEEPAGGVSDEPAPSTPSDQAAEPDQAKADSEEKPKEDAKGEDKGEGKAS